MSGADGSWFMAALPPGRYQVAAQIQGFKKFLRRDVIARGREPDERRRATRARRRRGDGDGAGESPIIDVSSKEIGGNITTKELSEIPSIARNFTYFAGLLPGIVPTANLASWGSDTLTANGVDSRNNSYLVDGGWDNDDYLGQNNGAQARVPLDAAQEFQVLTGQFDAEFGRTSGAIVNAVIKSGHQQVSRQRVRVLLQPRLRAKDFFQEQNNLAKADTQKHEFGGSLGGPIKQDKIHFFVDVERVRLNEGRTIQIPARPDLNYTTVTETRVWDTVYRVDHQISANTSWGGALGHRVVAAEEPDQQRRGHVDRRAAGMGSRRYRLDSRQLRARHQPRQHHAPVADARGRSVRAQRVPGRASRISPSASSGARTSTTASRSTRRRCGLRDRI